MKHTAETSHGDGQVISRITKGSEIVATIVVNGDPGKIDAVVNKAAGIIVAELNKNESNTVLIVGVSVVAVLGAYVFFGG